MDGKTLIVRDADDKIRFEVEGVTVESWAAHWQDKFNDAPHLYEGWKIFLGVLMPVSQGKTIDIEPASTAMPWRNGFGVWVVPVSVMARDGVVVCGDKDK